jgi:hypothetical protein
MTVTLEDMAMILALPIEGSPICIDTSCDDWRGKMLDLIWVGGLRGGERAAALLCVKRER